MPPDLLARFCKVNVLNVKKFGLIFYFGLPNATYKLRVNWLPLRTIMSSNQPLQHKIIFWRCPINLIKHRWCGWATVLFCLRRICFPGLIYCDQEPLWTLNVIEDDCYFLGVHIWLSTRCKTFHSKISQPFPQKSHEFALKLTDLWITSLLFDLNYNFINESFALSPG